MTVCACLPPRRRPRGAPCAGWRFESLQARRPHRPDCGAGSCPTNRDLTMAARFHFALPAAAEGFIEGDYCEPLIALGARQAELGRKKLLLRLQDLIIAGLAGHIALRG